MADIVTTLTRQLDCSLDMLGQGIDLLTSGNHIWKHKEIKPYLEDTYPEMEQFYYPTPTNPKVDPIYGPQDIPEPDCEPSGGASAILANYQKCADWDDCGAFIFSCAHKIKDFTGLACSIKSIEYLPGDRLG